ncbi:MAG: hypothetical protein RIG84_18785 [Roseovarius sp.]
MIRNLHDHLIAGVAAGALGLAGLSATPASADNDTAKIIAGAAALAIVGAAIADSADNRRYRGVTRGHGGYHPDRGHRGYYDRGYHRGGYGYGYDHHSYKRQTDRIDR